MTIRKVPIDEACDFLAALYRRERFKSFDVLHAYLWSSGKGDDHPDNSVGRASTFGGGGHGFESLQHHTKGVKMVLAAPSLTLA